MVFGSDVELAGVALSEGTSTFLCELVTEFLRLVFAAHWTQLAPGVSVDDAAEWFLRTILSLLMVRGPYERSRDGVWRYLGRLLLPAIVVGDGHSAP